MNDTVRRIGKMKLVPVASIKNPDQAAPLAEALKAGGLLCLEFTFRTAAAEAAIAKTAGIADMLIGAGTVLSVETAKRAVGAGAKFIVSPGLNPKVVGHCVENGIPVFPGVATPTEIETAMGFGLEVLKYFPAEAFGGTKTLKAISGPFPGIKFIPTGGVNPENLGEYLALSCVLACGGSWMVKQDLMDKGSYDEITRLTRDSVRIAAAAGK